MQANIRRIVSILLAVMFCVTCFTGCGSSNNGGSDTASVDVRNAKTIADLKGAKIAAQAGTFHADALSQRSDDLMGVGLFQLIVMDMGADKIVNVLFFVSLRK